MLKSLVPLHINIFQIYGQKEWIVLSNIKCVVCNGRNFLKGYYDVDLNVEIYSSAYSKVRHSVRSDSDVYLDIDVDTDIHHNEIISRGEIDFRVKNEEDKYSYDSISDVYKYICEDCGYIMSFTKEIEVETKEQEKKRKQKENGYDWTDFGK
jgi:hypothetical protein